MTEHLVAEMEDIVPDKGDTGRLTVYVYNLEPFTDL